jgi:hypothetical protein
MSPRLSKRGSSRPGPNAVFVNCPFDPEYKAIFDAVVFAVHRCGFLVRCALEDSDSNVVRIEKIVQMIAESDLGIHDLSRVDTHGSLPRFNMPFELGLFIGAQRYGSRRQRQKRCLILAGEPHQHQRFISDIAGQDVDSHQGKPEEAVRAVRQFLVQHAPRGAKLPGRDRILEDYTHFQRLLPGLLEVAGQDRESLTFLEFRGYVRDVVARQALMTG